MIEEFDNIAIAAEPASTQTSPQASPITPAFTSMCPVAKHHKPKSKKAAKKALKRMEQERNQLIYTNGRLTMENDTLKYMIKLSTAVSRKQLDTEMTSTTLALLSSAGKKNGR